MPMGNVKGLNEKLENKWGVGLFTSPCSEPAAFRDAIFCTSCVAYQQRTAILELTGEPYYCCAGVYPFGPLGQPCDPVCLFLETWFCLCCNKVKPSSCKRCMIHAKFMRIRSFFEIRCSYPTVPVLIS